MTPDGDLVIRSHHSGASLRDAWGGDDYEATLTIARDDLGDLALMLLKAAFAGQRDALDLLRAFCDRATSRMPSPSGPEPQQFLGWAQNS